MSYYRNTQIMQAFGVAHFNLEFYSVRDTYHQRILQSFTTTNGARRYKGYALKGAPQIEVDKHARVLSMLQRNNKYFIFQ